MTLLTSMKKAARSSRKGKGPLWEGPDGKGPQGGVSFSLLSRFLVCRDRFKVLTFDGLSAKGTFNHRMEFGSMWHACEEAALSNNPWAPSLKKYLDGCLRKYPFQQEEVLKWGQYCSTEFPLYLNYWKNHRDEKDREPMLQEQVFDVPYSLPSGNQVRLRGKWDGVNVLGKGLYLWENKTKNEIDERSLKRQLGSGFDLQTMLYLVALDKWKSDCAYSKMNGAAKKKAGLPINGLHYNVVRRPGQYQGKKETAEQFFARLRVIINEAPQEFFMRWRVEITEMDIRKFRTLTLDPILENLCWWWQSMTGLEHRLPCSPCHWRHPYGVWNTLDEGRMTDLDEYLLTGNRSGLEFKKSLFEELE